MVKLFQMAVVSLILVFASSAARAGDYEDAMAASRRGDDATALRLLSPLAQNGNTRAQVFLAKMYYVGQGVPQSYVESVRLFGLAAQQGDAEAQYFIGCLDIEGKIVAQDYKEAAKWIRLSADQGYKEAQSRLGAMYFNGAGVIQDYQEAARLFRLAAQQGYAYAQSALAGLYFLGFGVPRDFVRSYMWSNLAATSLSGDDLRKESSHRDSTAEFLTSEQIAQAQEMARKCQASNFKNCD